MMHGKIITVLGVLSGVLAVSYGSYEIFRSKNLQEYLSFSEKLLNFNADSEEHKDKWTELVKKYEEHDDSSLKPIDEFSLSKSSGDNYSENIKKLKEQCQKLALSSTKNLSKDQIDKKLGQIRIWCLQSSQGESKKAK